MAIFESIAVPLCFTLTMTSSLWWLLYLLSITKLMEILHYFVKLIALLNRLEMTCVILSLSAFITRLFSSGAYNNTTLLPFFWIPLLNSSTMLCINSVRLNFSLFSLKFPFVSLCNLLAFLCSASDICSLFFRMFFQNLSVA